MSDTNPLRSLPSVDRLLAHPLLAEGAGPLRLAATRRAVDEARDRVRNGGEAPSLDEIAARAIHLLRAMGAPSLRPVINATGVILHTNLGRAPLSDDALAAMHAVGIGYSNLEFDLDSGSRGTRFSHLEWLLQQVTGAEAGIAVNNNASAMLLLLSALCRDREVIISRGQAVEIGGGFRIPDVLRQSGAHLVEVGTTNRTTLRDFEDAIGERTAAILRVHASNFRIVGFTAFPELEDLAQVAHRRGILLLDDIGSGCLLDTRRFGLLPEPTVQESVAAGVDVVAFSGDKLLGGPQAGILSGRRSLVEAARRHPLARAVRMDKAGIAALAATLQHYLRGEELAQVPVWRMISAPIADLDKRATTWSEAAQVPVAVGPGRSMIGGGSLPEESLETRVLTLAVGDPDAAARTLRLAEPAIVARIEAGLLVLDPRTVHPRDDGAVAAAVARLE